MTAPASVLEREAVKAVLDRVHDFSAWVVGDVMLDEYAVGDVERISPEAPVPILRIGHHEARLGGAANVAQQMAVLGIRVRLAGLIGRDLAGDQLLKLCAAAGVDTRAVRRVDGRQTTRKLRALASNQQLVRLDFEDTAPCPPADAGWILRLLQAGRAPDVIVLSDYAKGVLTDELVDALARVAAAAGTPVVADPKRRDFRGYPRGSVLTPNLRELEVATGMPLGVTDTSAIVTAAQRLVTVTGATALVIKRGRLGMLLVRADAPPVDIPARGRVLFDATGAGDTVIAVLAATLTAGARLDVAARIANVAAGIAVGKVGTVSVHAAEILDGLTGWRTHKILDRTELVAQAQRWRIAGKRIVVTNGCFDLLHAGHLALLHEAAGYGEALIVAINSDASVRRLKGPTRPVVPAHERAAMLAALACVDAVTIFDEDTPLSVLRAILPDVLVKGQDYQLQQVVGRELVEARGGRVVLVPLVPEHSTTALVEKIGGRLSEP